ncbi:MAG: hypothetical protein AAB074_12630 [Planctomycetota bacterium]
MSHTNIARLLERFNDAGLALTVNREQRRGVRGDVFSMSVERAGKENKERFVLFPGATERLEVLDVSPVVKQAVLLVKEPERSFTQRAWDRKLGDYVDHVQVTPGTTRRYLVGMDERSYFMAELPRPVTTVKEAHRALRPGEVVDWESRRENRGKKAVRQGEWLFLPLPPSEARELDNRIARKQALVRQKARIPGRPGKPHVAFRLVVEARMQAPVVYAQGSVRHADHDMLHLNGWHRVVANMEVRRAQVGSWID